jgi:hypothetical protein
VNVLQQIFPSIKEVGALFLGHFEKGQFREFGPEPWNKNLYVIPRNTAGYILTDFLKKSMISLLNANGIWSHFVHPDDVYPLGERYGEKELTQIGIKKLNWRGEPEKKGLYYFMIHWLEFVKKHYPWLRHMNRKEAYSVMQNYDKTRIGFKKQRNILNLEINVTPSYFALYLRKNNKIRHYAGCEVVHSYSGEVGEHYIIKAIAGSMRIEFTNSIR